MHSHGASQAEGPRAGLNALLLLSGNFFNVILYVSVLELFDFGRIVCASISPPEINLRKTT